MKGNDLEKEMIQEYHYSRPRALVNGCMAVIILCGIIIGGTTLMVALINFFVR